MLLQPRTAERATIIATGAAAVTAAAGNSKAHARVRALADCLGSAPHHARTVRRIPRALPFPHDASELGNAVSRGPARLVLFF